MIWVISKIYNQSKSKDPKAYRCKKILKIMNVPCVYANLISEQLMGIWYTAKRRLKVPRKILVRMSIILLEQLIQGSMFTKLNEQKLNRNNNTKQWWQKKNAKWNHLDRSAEPNWTEPKMNKGIKVSSKQRNNEEKLQKLKEPITNLIAVMLRILKMRMRYTNHLWCENLIVINILMIMQIT